MPGKTRKGALAARAVSGMTTRPGAQREGAEKSSQDMSAGTIIRKLCSQSLDWRLAEAGCTPHEMAAITGHASLKEIVRYTATAKADFEIGSPGRIRTIDQPVNRN